MDRCCVRFYFCVEVRALVFEKEFNRVVDALLCFFAEAFEEEETVFLAGVEELAEGFYFHFFPDRGDFFGAESFDAEHFEDAWGCFMDVFVEEGEVSGGDDLGDFLGDGIADAFDRG